MVLLYFVEMVEESKDSKVGVLRMEQKANHCFVFELQKTWEEDWQWCTLGNGSHFWLHHNKIPTLNKYFPCHLSPNKKHTGSWADECRQGTAPVCWALSCTITHVLLAFQQTFASWKAFWSMQVREGLSSYVHNIDKMEENVNVVIMF